MDSQLAYTLIGLYAYDTGCVSSGIKDELLRQEALRQLGILNVDDRRTFLAELVREHFLSAEAVQQGYGLEDAQEFANWLDEQGALI